MYVYIYINRILIGYRCTCTVESPMSVCVSVCSSAAISNSMRLPSVQAFTKCHSLALFGGVWLLRRLPIVPSAQHCLLIQNSPSNGIINIFHDQSLERPDCEKYWSNSLVCNLLQLPAFQFIMATWPVASSWAVPNGEPQFQSLSAHPFLQGHKSSTVTFET